MPLTESELKQLIGDNIGDKKALILKMLSENNSKSETERDGLDELERLKNGLRRFQRWNHAASSALGACQCWGENRRCNYCRGNGRPGWKRPDIDNFENLVVPALDRLEQESNRHSDTIEAENERND